MMIVSYTRSLEPSGEGAGRTPWRDWRGVDRCRARRRPARRRAATAVARSPPGRVGAARSSARRRPALLLAGGRRHRRSPGPSAPPGSQVPPSPRSTAATAGRALLASPRSPSATPSGPPARLRHGPRPFLHFPPMTPPRGPMKVGVIGLGYVGPAARGRLRRGGPRRHRPRRRRAPRRAPAPRASPTSRTSPPSACARSPSASSPPTEHAHARRLRRGPDLRPDAAREPARARPLLHRRRRDRALAGSCARASSSCSSRPPTRARPASGCCRSSRSPGSPPARDFHLAFSPERIDPGRTDHTIRTTPKVVGGLTDGLPRPRRRALRA